MLEGCVPKIIPPEQMHTLVPATYYKGTKDFVNQNGVKAGLLLVEEKNQYIKVKRIYDLKTGIKIKLAQFSWAINYKNHIYFNLFYSSDVKHDNFFAKLDIEGKYCALIIDKNSPNLFKNSNSDHGGALQTVIINGSAKWGKSFYDKRGNWKRILFINTQEKDDAGNPTNNQSIGSFLTRKRLKQVMVDSKIQMSEMQTTDLEFDNIHFEKVMEIIEEANKRSE